MGLGACAVVARCRVLEKAVNGGPVSAWRAGGGRREAVRAAHLLSIMRHVVCPPRMVHMDKDVHAKILLNYKRPP